MEIPKEALLQTCESLKAKGFDYLKKITAVDRSTHLEVVYVLSNAGHGIAEKPEQEILTIKLASLSPSVPSIIKLYPAADWYERELYEMFGVEITGRGTVGRLLLEEWNGKEFPLLKSFEWGKEYEKG